MAFSIVWDAAEETTPANSDKIRLGAGKIRDSKVNIRERLQIDHEFSTLSSGTDSGFHKRVTLLKTSIAEPASGYVVLAAVANVLHYFGQGDEDRTLVDLSLSQTLVNKTLTAPVIATIVNSGVLTLPTGAETLVGRATTDTLTNKTITAAANTLSIAHGDLSDDPTTGVHGMGASTVVGTALSQILTNKTIDGDNNTLSNLDHGAEVDDPTTGVHGVGVGAIVGTALSQILTNKTIDGDNNTITNLAHGAEVDDLTTGVHGVGAGAIVGTALTQTLTNKTLTGNIAVTLISGAATLTLPTTTATLSTLALSETLTNKTLSGNIAVTLISGAATLTLPTTTGTLATLANSETFTNKTLTTPTIASFVNSTHNHSNAAGGGNITLGVAVPEEPAETGNASASALASPEGHTHPALKMIIWRMLNDETSGTQNPLGAGGSDWEISDDAVLENPLGASVITESSGEFSFAEIGWWAIRFYGGTKNSSQISIVTMELAVTDDDFSTEAIIASSSNFHATTTGSSGNVSGEVLIEIVDGANDKVKLTQATSGDGKLAGSPSANLTYISFEKKAQP